jgi:hypothetical protein
VSPGPAAGRPRTATAPRLGWLDALRGIAALCVVFDHPTYSALLFLGGVHRRSSRYTLVFAVAALALGRVLQPGSPSFDLLRPGVVVTIADSVILLGLALALAGRGRTRSAGAALAAVTGPLVICGLTHRFIEAPMHRLGRRVSARLDTRFGPGVQRPSPSYPGPGGAQLTTLMEHPCCWDGIDGASMLLPGAG